MKRIEQMDHRHVTGLVLRKDSFNKTTKQAEKVPINPDWEEWNDFFKGSLMPIPYEIG